MCCFHVSFVEKLYQDSLYFSRLLQSRRVLFWHMLKKLCIIFSGMQTYICIPYICTLHDFIWGSICNTPRGFTQIYIWYCHFRHGTVTVSRAFTGEDCQYSTCLYCQKSNKKLGSRNPTLQSCVLFFSGYNNKEVVKY